MKELLFEYPFAQDYRKWDCIALEVDVPEDSVLELRFTVYPLVVGRPEYIDHASAVVTVAGEGWQKVEIAFRQFAYPQAAGAFWRFIKKVEVDIQGMPENTCTTSTIRNARLKQKGILDVRCERYSKSGQHHETVFYEYTIQNQSEKVQAISMYVEKLGWESMTTQLMPDKLILAPQESKSCRLKVNLQDRVAAGGYEQHKVVIVPNGDINPRKELEFITVCKLPHPYLLHDEKGWGEVAQKVKDYPWAKEALDRYVEIAEKWKVPEVNGGNQAFELMEWQNIEAAGIAWKLTGRREFGEKIAALMRCLADPVNGYPATSSSIFHSVPVPSQINNESTLIQKICTGGLIHEGEFLMVVCAAYDLIYEEGFLCDEDKARIEKAFRIFIEKIDWAITDGDCNNIPSGGMAAALFCSLVLQDMHWVNRFIYGANGVLNFLSVTILDDGWYFEGATNYVLLGAHIYTRIAQALLPWGINFKDAYISARYGKNIMLTPWSFMREKPFLGMSFEKQGTNLKNCHRIVDFWDGLLPFVDYRGILFAINDSKEKEVSALYEMAYYMYRKPEYATVVRNSGKRNLLYGVPELPDTVDKPYIVSAYADNVGVAMLRSQKSGRDQREQMQVVLRYGIHGGYHGHFDKTDLVSVMRYGKSIYNTEASWYGYGTYLFKMWVQNSIAHNMITVDQRMQEPAVSNKRMFYSGKHMQACVVETIARWFDPPYGGQTPYPEQFPEEKAWNEARYIPIPEIPRGQGETGEYSEPVKQRRMVVVTDDYIVMTDWVKSDNPHEFDNWLHLSGYKGITARSLEHRKHTEKLNDDPYGGGQFITDCDWYDVKVPAVVNFGYEYDHEQDSKKVFTEFNEDGYMNVDVHSLWPLNSHVIIGNHPEPDDINKRLTYEVAGDGKVLASGKFGAWILGKDTIHINVQGISRLEIKTWVERSSQTRKTLFLGNPFILTEKGDKFYLSDLPIEKNNVFSHADPSTDYYGGPIKLEGMICEKAVGIEPENADMPASIILDISRIQGAMEFVGMIGGDYPLGPEDRQRKSLSIRTCGNEAKYITILELHENNSLIEQAHAFDENHIKVRLKDGRTQEIEWSDFYQEEGTVRVCMKERLHGVVTCKEDSGGNKDMHDSKPVN